MCSTKALLGGDGDVIADIYRERVLRRGRGAEVWGWSTAYGLPPKAGQQPPQQQPGAQPPTPQQPATKGGKS
jgi:formate dehydrogenase iron-sulfur subunit